MNSMYDDILAALRRTSPPVADLVDAALRYCAVSERFEGLLDVNEPYQSDLADPELAKRRAEWRAKEMREFGIFDDAEARLRACGKICFRRVLPEMAETTMAADALREMAALEDAPLFATTLRREAVA